MASKVEWVIKPGNVEKKKLGHRQPGLDLTRAVFDILKDDGMVVTDDCCNYWPTFPQLTVADHDVPTEDEMVDIPLKGLFVATDGTDYALHFKLTASTTVSLGTTT